MSFKVAFILYELFNGPVGRLEGIEALCCTRIHFSLLNWNWQIKDFFLVLEVLSMHGLFYRVSLWFLVCQGFVTTPKANNETQIAHKYIVTELHLYLVERFINKGDVILSLEDKKK